MTELEKAQAKLAKRASAFARVFASPDGQEILKDLEFRFNGTALKKKDGLIDPYATVAMAGCREVLLYIDHMRKQNVLDG